MCAMTLAAPAVVAGCGGDDDGGDEDPAALLREAFSQNTNYDSGVINIGLDGSVEGSAVNAALDASVTGPFQSGGEGEPPELALDATANVQASGIPNLPGDVSFDFSGGLALADDSLFVTYDDTTYEAGDRLYSQISPLLESATTAGESTQDPESADQFINALTNLENEGTEEVEGESVVHVSGDLDFASLAEEAAAAGAAPFDASQLEGLTSTIDVFVAEEDNTFRGLDLGFAASDVAALSAAGVDTLDFTISIGISGVNEEQTIEAPADAEPLDTLLREQLGTSEAEISQAIEQGLQGLIAPTGGLPGAGGEIPGLGGDAGAAATDPEVQECIQNAADSDAIIECLNQ
jgi:hypothetical protein